MQPNYPQELMASHALLSNLEIELAKERNTLIQHCNGKPIYAASYYPVLEHYYSLTEQYVAELSNFRKLLHSVEQQQAPPLNASNNNVNVNEASIVVPSSVPDTSSSTVMRKIATSMNGANYVNDRDAAVGIMGSDNVVMDDTKQPEPNTMPSSSLPHTANVNLMNNTVNVGVTGNNDEVDRDDEMKVTSLYAEEQATGHSHVHSSSAQRRKPPVKSSSSSAATMAMMNTEEPPRHGHHPMPPSYAAAAPPLHSHAAHVHVKPQSHAQATRPPRKLLVSAGGVGGLSTTAKPRSQLKVQRHKYKYEGRGFQIWKQNLQRPIYTATTLRLSRKFGTDDKQIRFTGDEKAVRRFLSEKGGFKPEYIEQITFIPKREVNAQGQGQGSNRTQQKLAPNQIDFIIVRVRASLQYIFQCIDQIEKLYGPDVIKKQNNRSKTNSSSKNSAKLYVNNFDVLDENTHRNLTKIFVRYGELEQDIFIGKDKKQNPYAMVQFRDARDAQRCVNAHQNYQSTIFFPPRENENDTGDSNSPSNNKQQQRFFNRKLHIEYVTDNDQNARKQSANRSRRGGRGGGRRQ